MTNDDTERTTENQNYPFGLSSRALFIFIVIVGIITPGVLIYLLAQANMPVLADLVWILGFGTTVFVAWYIWLRPLDLVGSSGQELAPIEPEEETDTDSEDSSPETADSADNGQVADSQEQDSDPQEAATNTE